MAKPFFSFQSDDDVTNPLSQQVDDSDYVTYPSDFTSERAAKACAVQTAIRKIKAAQQKLQYPMFTGSMEELLKMLYDLVVKHEAGVFINEIPNMIR